MRRKHAARRSATARIVREARERKGVSQRALSRKLNEHATYVYEIEQEQHSVRADELVYIAVGLDMDPRELYDSLVEALLKKRA